MLVALLGGILQRLENALSTLRSTSKVYLLPTKRPRASRITKRIASGRIAIYDQWRAA